MTPFKFLLPLLLLTLSCNSNKTDNAFKPDAAKLVVNNSLTDTNKQSITDSVHSRQQEQQEEHQYTDDFDTALKGGYSISCKVDDSSEYLYLKKRNRTIAELSSMSRGLPYKNLGYIGVDFTHYFVLVHSTSMSNPHQVELIEKTTGRNIIEQWAYGIDADEKQEILLYCDKDVPSPKDKMILYNVATKRREIFNFPSYVFDEPEILNRIKIKELTNKSLVIAYRTDNGSKTKTYSR